MFRGICVALCLIICPVLEAIQVKTKVVCTIGPASNSEEGIIGLMDAGMNVARLNFSHGAHEGYRELIARIKKARKLKGQPLGILLDTKGPEVRVGILPEGSMQLEEGKEVWLVESVDPNSSDQIPVNPPIIMGDLSEGNSVLFDDGAIASTVVEVDPAKGVRLKLKNGGKISSRKGINIPDVSLSLPNVTEQDEKDIRFGCQQGVDMMALSFARSAEHIHEVRKILAEENRPDVLLIAKIESWEGIENLESIVQAADGIMVARGDLGVELPLSRVPQLQKEMIYKCYMGGKPSVTATQMLESMIHNPRPTRAEVSDVSNAVGDGSSAVMLSGETAMGKYPLESVSMMRKVIAEAEKNFDYDGFLVKSLELPSYDVHSSIAAAAVRSAHNSRAKAIFAIVKSGASVRFLSRLRPSIPIVAFTSSERVYSQLSLYWGVSPVLVSAQDLKDKDFSGINRIAVEKGFVENGDLVVITASGENRGHMVIKNVGDIAFRGDRGFGTTVSAEAVSISGPTVNKNVLEKVAIIPICDDRFEPIVRDAAAILLQNLSHDTASEKSAIQLCEKYQKPLVTGVTGERDIPDGQVVTVEPRRAVGFLGRQR